MNRLCSLECSRRNPYSVIFVNIAEIYIYKMHQHAVCNCVNVLVVSVTCL